MREITLPWLFFGVVTLSLFVSWLYAFFVLGWTSPLLAGLCAGPAPMGLLVLLGGFPEDRPSIARRSHAGPVAFTGIPAQRRRLTRM